MDKITIEAVVVGMWVIIQAAFWLWIKTSIDKQKEFASSIAQTNTVLQATRLEMSKDYVHKDDLRDFIDRNDKVLSKIEAHLMAKKE